jgi:hypothetical protein
VPSLVAVELLSVIQTVAPTGIDIGVAVIQSSFKGCDITEMQPNKRAKRGNAFLINLKGCMDYWFNAIS